MADETTEIKAAGEIASPVDVIVRPKVAGYVTYDVNVRCPHCDKRLQLNQYPYNNDDTDYCLAEDELGLALFGGSNNPAKWDGLDIEYKCCGCTKTFHLGSLEP